MGIVAKQSIHGSIWSYLGVVLGFVTNTYLFSEYLTPEIVGLFGILVAISTITANISALGMNNVTARLFPYFRNNDNGHNGYLFLAIVPELIGYAIFLIIFLLFQDKIIENNIEKSALFADYVYLLIPITFFFLVFSLFDTYNRLLYNALLGTFLQEFLQRVAIFTVVGLYIIKVINLNQLIIGYALAVSVKAIVIFIYLILKKQINLKPKLNFVTPKLRKEIVGVASFSIIGGLGSLMVFNIDKIVINQLLDLEKTGVFTMAVYFGTLVVIPSRPLLQISGTLIADSWAKKDLQHIGEIYQKSCLNQFLIGGFLFLGIWVNIDNILFILGDDYAESKWVIFFIGIGYMFDMLTGANGHIIRYSKHYRISLVFTAFLLVTNVVLLYTLVPLLGIVGAAISIAFSLFFNNFMRFLFLVRKYQLQPFNARYLFILGFFLVVYFIIDFIPQLNIYVDIVVRGAILSVSVLVVILKSNYFPDLKQAFNNTLQTINKKFNS